MSGTMVEFAANGGTANGYLAMPASGHGPGLLVLQEWWGLVDHIKRVADRFAAAGYVALAPDLYRGESATSPTDAQRLLMALDMADTAKTLRGAADYLLAHESVTPKRVGAVGFCMGGQLALFAATAHPDVIHAVVDFYGIFNPNVPVDVSALRAPVLGHFGAHDASIPLAKVEALFDEIARTGVSCESHIYDAGHAFFNETRPAVHQPEAAQLAWDRTLHFLENTLMSA